MNNMKYSHALQRYGNMCAPIMLMWVIDKLVSFFPLEYVSLIKTAIIFVMAVGYLILAVMSNNEKHKGTKY